MKNLGMGIAALVIFAGSFARASEVTTAGCEQDGETITQVGLFCGKGDCWGDWRPCGPGNSCGGNTHVKQGFYGADFRPACAAHDQCLANGCKGHAARKCCDQQFRANMHCACECSSNPKACVRKANHYYRAARLFGWMWH